MFVTDPFLLDNYIHMLLTGLTVLAVLLSFFCIYLYQNRKTVTVSEETAEDERRLREEILDNMEEIFIALSTNDRKVLFANTAASSFLEMPKNKIIGTDFSRLTPLSSNRLVRETIIDCQNTREDSHALVEIEKGNVKLLHDLNVSFYERRGHCLLMIVARSLEERVRGSNTVRETGEKIREIEKLGKLGYWEMFNEDKRTTWSRGLYDLLGYEVNEIKPNLDFLYQMIVPEEQPVINRAFVAAFQNQQAFDQIIKLKKRNQEEMNMLLRVRHSFDRTNNLVSTLGFMQDITEFTKMEKDLDYITQLSRTIIDHADILLFVVDSNKNIVLVNNYLAMLLGKPVEEMIGKPADDVFIKIIEENQNRFSKTHYFEGVIELPKTQYGNRAIRWSLSRFNTKDDEELTICLGIDMTQSELAKRRLSRKAEREDASGFINRRTFDYQMTKYFIKSRYKENRRMALLEIIAVGQSFDGLKVRHHDTARALVEIAGRLREVFGPQIVIDSDGRGAFRVFLPNRSREQVLSLAEQAADALSKPLMVQEVDPKLAPRIGIAFLEDSITTLLDFTNRAEDAALLAIEKNVPILIYGEEDSTVQNDTIQAS